MVVQTPGRHRIVIVGSSNTDMNVKVRRIPKPGETVLGDDFFMAAGGKGANQAVAAARAVQNRSRSPVYFVGRFGRDLFGRSALEGLRREGVRTVYAVRDRRTASGVALIVIDKEGENAIAVASGANARLSAADVDKASRTIATAAVLLLQLEIPLKTVRRAAGIAAVHEVPVILNPAPAQPLPDDLLRCVSILTPNETEASLLTGIHIKNSKGLQAAAGALLEKGLRAVLITRGAQGVYAATRDAQETVPAFKTKAVDSTAAGDVFNGALAVALAEGLSLLQAVRFASAAGAISVTRLGAQPSAPTRAEIDVFLKKH